MKYYLCEICGNLVELVQVGGGQLVCCGKPMKELIPKINDEGNEKHLPVVTKEDLKIYVKISSVEHPMTEEHHINWITIYYNGKTQRKKLNYTDKPEATFIIFEEFETMEIYSYCNIHGLWKTVFKNN